MTIEEIRTELMKLEEIQSKLKKEEEYDAENFLPSNPIHYMLGYGFIAVIFVLLRAMPRTIRLAKIEERMEQLEQLRHRLYT